MLRGVSLFSHRCTRGGVLGTRSFVNNIGKKLLSVLYPAKICVQCMFLVCTRVTYAIFCSYTTTCYVIEAMAATSAYQKLTDNEKVYSLSSWHAVDKKFAK